MNKLFLIAFCSCIEDNENIDRCENTPPPPPSLTFKNQVFAESRKSAPKCFRLNFLSSKMVFVLISLSEQAKNKLMFLQVIA